MTCTHKSSWSLHHPHATDIPLGQLWSSPSSIGGSSQLCGADPDINPECPDIERAPILISTSSAYIRHAHLPLDPLSSFHSPRIFQLPGVMRRLNHPTHFERPDRLLVAVIDADRVVEDVFRTPCIWSSTISGFKRGKCGAHLWRSRIRLW